MRVNAVTTPVTPEGNMPVQTYVGAKTVAEMVLPLDSLTLDVSFPPRGGGARPTTSPADLRLVLSAEGSEELDSFLE